MAFTKKNIEKLSLNREICLVGKYPGIHLLHKAGLLYERTPLLYPGTFVFRKQGRGGSSLQSSGVSQEVKGALPVHSGGSGD